LRKIDRPKSTVPKTIIKNTTLAIPNSTVACPEAARMCDLFRFAFLIEMPRIFPLLVLTNVDTRDPIEMDEECWP